MKVIIKSDYQLPCELNLTIHSEAFRVKLLRQRHDYRGQTEETCVKNLSIAKLRINIG